MAVKTLEESEHTIFMVSQVRDYITNKQYEVSNRVTISDVTPFERHLWNKLVTKQTSQQTQQATKEFLKLALLCTK